MVFKWGLRSQYAPDIPRQRGKGRSPDPFPSETARFAFPEPEASRAESGAASSSRRGRPPGRTGQEPCPGTQASRTSTSRKGARYLPPSWLLWIQSRTLRAQRLDLDNARLVGDPVTIADPASGFSVSDSGLIAYRTALDGHWLAHEGSGPVQFGSTSILTRCEPGSLTLSALRRRTVRAPRVVRGRGDAPR